MKPFLVVNPASANGRTGRFFDTIAHAVREAVGDFDHVFTKHRGDASRLAREAVLAGERFIVAVGGDGTASEVIHGLFERDRALHPDVVFGLIPRGTGGDLKRTVGISKDVKEAARVLKEGALRRCDVGLVEFQGHDGAPDARYFINVADLGVGGVVVEEVNRGSKALGGRLSFMIGSAKGLLKYSDQPVRFRVDGGAWEEDRLTALAVCNGRYFGGGMMVAPEASMEDGVFDVTIWKGMRFSDFALRSAKLYNGSHLELRGTRTFRARELVAEPLEGARVLLDVDGEQPGLLPARFRILPGAIQMRTASNPGDLAPNRG